MIHVYRVGPPPGDHGWWLGIFGGIVPSLLLLILTGVGVWAVLRRARLARTAGRIRN